MLPELSIRYKTLYFLRFCLNFDLVAPPVDAVSYITVEQKNIELYSSGLPTSKALGFQMNKDTD